MVEKKQYHEKSLSAYLKQSKSAFVCVFVFSAIINMLMLVSPIFMLQIYDRVLTSQSVETLIALSFIAVFLLLFMALLEASRQRIATKIALQLSQNLSGKLFEAIFKIQSPEGKKNQGTVPLQDLEQLKKFVSEPSIFSFFDSPWVPVYVGIVFILHFYLGMIALSGVIIIFFIAIVGEYVSRTTTNNASKQSHVAMSMAQNSLKNAEVILSMNILQGLHKQWNKTHMISLSESMKSSHSVAMVSAFIKTFRLMLQVAMLAVGGYLVIHNEISAGTMIVGSIIMGRALQPVEQSIASWRSFIYTRNAWHRLNRLIPLIANQPEYVPLPRPKGKLDVSELFIANNGSNILQNIHFCLQPNEIMCIVGPSGAGKTTLMQAIAGLHTPKLGHVRLDGVIMTNWSLEDRGKYIGYLPQDVELFNGTIAENIARFQEKDDTKIINAGILSRCHDFILQLPHTYSTIIGEGGHVLSGGQMQKIALARAVYDVPALLLFDEPTSNVDSEGEKAFYDCILECKKMKNCTIILISHSPKVFQIADKALYLHNGKALAFGSTEDVYKVLQGK